MTRDPLRRRSALNNVPSNSVKPHSDFSLDQRENHFRLNFRDPTSEMPCHFTLSPAGLQSLNEISLHCYSDLFGMEYFSYSHLRLTGLANGERVCGEAWLDHQWGNYGWLVESDENRELLGGTGSAFIWRSY